jgi:hypothetical protein
MAGVIGSVAELVFQAGRDTDVDDAAGDGTLTVADGVVLQSSDRLALLAGASGFGDLVFEENGAFTLAANDIELRAGAGPDSLNDDQDDRSRILAFQSERNTLIDIRRAEMMADFVSTPGIELSFEFRQDEGIDSDPDLPDFDRFSSAPGIDSFGTAGPLVEYRVRSDKGSIDFRGDATGGDRFTQAALSLIGRQSDDDPAIRVDDTFAFEGTQLELGSGTDFTYTQRLADAFNPTDDPSAVRDRITLRAGVNGSGTLRFEGEDEDSVAVTARQIDLVASAGANGQGESRIQVDNGEFDLSGGTFGPRTLVYQVDGDIDVDDLPSQGQFTGGLPNILAIRADDGRLRLEDFDITSLPLFLDDVPGSDIGARLILEGDIVSLSEDDGGDLVLTPDLPADPNDPLRNLRLRLRANTLQLEASTSDVDSGDGRVLLGGRNEETPPVEGTDTDYSTQTLLIEGFDASTEIATTENLSALSEVEDDPGIYNLEDGRGPTSIVIDQDGAVTPDELPLRFAIAGYLERSTASDENDEPIATSYGISSLQSTVTLTPDNVSGSDLRIGGSNAPIKGDISFDIGDSSLYLDETGGLYPGASNLYAFENVAAYSGDSIIVSSGVTMSATDTILLAAAVPLTPFQPTEPIQQMGNLVFGDQDPSDDTDVVRNIILRANQILLTAGSNGTITNPDEDGDGQRDPIPQSALAQIDFRGLQSIEREGDFGTSLLAVRQSRNFNLGSEDELPTNVGRGDIVTPLTFNAPAAPEDEWNTLDLSSIQGRLTVTRIGEISEFTQSLTLGRTRPDASVVVETLLTDPFADRDGLGGFEGQVRLEANDVTFQFPSTAPDDAEFTLNTPRLQLVSDTIVSGTEAFDSEGRLRSDLFESGAPLRPIVRVKQPGDFASTFLPRPDRYFRIPLTIERDSTEQLRGSLEEIDIELTTTGSELTLGDDVREGASFSNLILQTLDPTANITIDFDSLTPGYDTYDFAANDIDSFDYAALQLTSLDMHANRSIQEGTITVAPFSPDVVDGMLSDMPADLTITTAGDQRFGGDVALQETLSTNGRDIRFTGDVYRDGSSGLARDDAGLIVESRHEVFFEENIGVHDNLAQLDSALGKLWLLFDSDARFGTPSVQFGKRIDLDGDGIAETPVNSNQTVLVNGDIVFATLALDDPNNPQDEDDGNLVDDFRNDIEMARTLGNIANALARYDVGRIDTAPYATIGKSRGDLTFRTLGQYSHFIMASGERLSVGGDLEINQIDAPDAVVTLGDVGALDIEVVNANQIGLVRRNAGVTLLPDGSSSQDAGPVILANTLDFGGTPLEVIGRGKTTRFGVENPYDPTLPSELNAFGVFANTNDGGLLSPGSFAFDPSLLEYVDVVASLLPAGASRSELAGANGPFFLPTPTPAIRDTPPLEHPERMMELDVEALPLPTDATLARLEGAAVIDDLGRMSDDYTARVSDVRLDEQDSELAVALHGKLFGPDGDRAGEVREILQDALDRYLETTRARRVIGFELRRFVKNRPSSLLEAYTTLDELDSLFRYHRRLGLSPGEYRRIQHVWLQDIQPDGITLDELSEAIHPSRYVRGSDILDIFGR